LYDRGVEEDDPTCWTVIRGAAAGDRRDRAEFARRYMPVIRAYLGARWRGTPLLAETDDATQEVFLDCFREGGALTRVRPGPARAFRAFLHGVVRNVALRTEQARRRSGRPLDSGFDPPAEDPSLSDVFDRAFARSLIRQAAARQADLARDAGPEALRRVDLLRLRFEEALPIREIARLWDADPAVVHHEYAKARREFRRALAAVVREHHLGDDAEVEAECGRLLAHFS
jgi:RNA polymerase sigma-70 factor (ECF subfamily)